MSQLGLVEVAGGEPVGAEDRLAVERSPFAVRGAGEVGDDHVRVQVRILRPRGAVSERRRHEALAALADCSAAAAAHDARLPLQVGERGLPGRLVRLADLASHPFVVGERVEDADALRAGEDEVVAGQRCQPLLLLSPLAGLDVEHAHGDRPLPDGRPQPVVARRVDAAKQRAQIAVADHAHETKMLGPAAGPDAGRLSPARVVVIYPASDLLLVVGLLAHRQLRHAQHARPSPRPTSAETHMHRQVRKKVELPE